jgi:hypothetical protein
MGLNRLPKSAVLKPGRETAHESSAPIQGKPQQGLDFGIRYIMIALGLRRPLAREARQARGQHIAEAQWHVTYEFRGGPVRRNHGLGNSARKEDLVDGTGSWGAATVTYRSGAPLNKGIGFIILGP